MGKADDELKSAIFMVDEIREWLGQDHFTMPAYKVQSIIDYAGDALRAIQEGTFCLILGHSYDRMTDSFLKAFSNVVFFARDSLAYKSVLEMDRGEICELLDSLQLMFNGIVPTAISLLVAEPKSNHSKTEAKSPKIEWTRPSRN